MLIHPPKVDGSRPKEVKVKIAPGYHVRLHAMRVLTGKPISEAVTEALDAYFAELDAARAAPPSEAAR